MRFFSTFLERKMRLRDSSPGEEFPDYRILLKKSKEKVFLVLKVWD